jgi:hypothetical protein
MLGIDTITDHFTIVGEKPIKLVPGNRIAVAVAGVAKNEVESQDASSNIEGDKIFDIAIDVVIDMVIVGGGLARAIEIEDALVQEIRGRREVNAGIKGRCLKLEQGQVRLQQE